MEKLSFTISALLQTVLGEGRDITFILLSKHNTMFFIRFANYQKKKKNYHKMKSINSKTNEGHLSHFSFTHTPSHELIIPFQNILLLLQKIDN